MYVCMYSSSQKIKHNVTVKLVCTYLNCRICIINHSYMTVVKGSENEPSAHACGHAEACVANGWG